MSDNKVNLDKSGNVWMTSKYISYSRHIAQKAMISLGIHPSDTRLRDSLIDDLHVYLQVPLDDLHQDINDLKQQAIEKGFAEYNKTTGEWQWKNKEVEK